MLCTVPKIPSWGIESRVEWGWRWGGAAKGTFFPGQSAACVALPVHVPPLVNAERAEILQRISLRVSRASRWPEGPGEPSLIYEKPKAAGRERERRG